MTIPTGYNLVWSDEFTGASLDTSKWRQTIGPSSNVKVGNGNLQLTANPIGDFNGSAFISTLNTFKYGYFECSAQISTVQGICFAFWMLDPGHTSTEIDIVERPGNAPGYQNICVFSLNNGSGWSTGGVHQQFPATATGFHKYALLWTPTDIIYYVDDVEGWRATTANAAKVNIPLNLKLDICAGGCSFQGIIIPPIITGSTSAFVDYVRVYQQGGPSPVLGTITVAPASSNINIGATQSLTVVCQDASHNVMTCPTITWSSSNSSIASVDSHGVVTGVAQGTVSITATSGGVTSNVATVTVAGPIQSKRYNISNVINIDNSGNATIVSSSITQI